MRLREGHSAGLRNFSLLVLAALALWTIARPQQGPHDWLARVWVVLR